MGLGGVGMRRNKAFNAQPNFSGSRRRPDRLFDRRLASRPLRAQIFGGPVGRAAVSAGMGRARAASGRQPLPAGPGAGRRIGDNASGARRTVRTIARHARPRRRWCRQPSAQAVVATPAAVQLAVADAGHSATDATHARLRQLPAAAPVHRPRRRRIAAAPPRANRAPAVAPSRVATNRPGYMLDDAQIASIKERLHLTPDQQQMWPAVEAALRNIAYTRAQQARRRGFSGERYADGRHRSGERGRSQIRSRSADHEFQRRAKARSAQPRPRHGARSIGVAVLIAASAESASPRAGFEISVAGFWRRYCCRTPKQFAGALNSDQCQECEAERGRRIPAGWRC